MQKVEIRTKGYIDEQWEGWFGDLTIQHTQSGETVLTGLLPDQAALYGMIARLRDLGIQLNSVKCEKINDNA
jgi:hypothetical protein